MLIKVHAKDICLPPDDLEFRGLLVVPIGQDESRDGAIRLAWMGAPRRKRNDRPWESGKQHPECASEMSQGWSSSTALMTSDNTVRRNTRA